MYVTDHSFVFLILMENPERQSNTINTFQKQHVGEIGKNEESKTKSN